MNYLIDMIISRNFHNLLNSDYFQCSNLGISGTVFWARYMGPMVTES